MGNLNNPSAPSSATTLFKADPTQISAHLNRLFGRCESEYPGGLFEIRCIHPTKKNNNRKLIKAQLSVTTPAGLVEGATWAAAQNEGEGFNTYVGVNPRKPGTPPRVAASKDDVEIAFFQFADIDSDASVKILRTTQSLKYTFAVTTGRVPNPRPHIYWELEEPTRNMTAWRDQQAALADHFQSDRVIDPPRIMRLAGTINYPDAKKIERGYRTELVKIRVEYDGESRAPVSSEAMHTAYPIQNRKKTTSSSSLNLPEFKEPIDPAKCLETIAQGVELHNNARDFINHMASKGEPRWLIDHTIRTALEPVSDGGTLSQVEGLIDSAMKLYGSPDQPETVEWASPDMGVLSEGRRPPPEFPLEPFCPFWRNWLTVSAEGASAPVDYVGAGLLGGAAALIGSARSASPWSEWIEPSILWLSIIGSPSSGKTPALQGPLSILRRLEAERGQDFSETLRQYESQKEAAQASRDAWRGEIKTATSQNTPPPDMPESAIEPERPQMPRLLVNDATPEALAKILANEPKGVLSVRDELAGWLASFTRYSTGSGRQFWLETYQGKRFVIDRVKNENGPIIVPFLSVSVLGGIQPDRLASALLQGDDDGLVSRFLYVWPDAIPPKRPSIKVNNTEAETALRRLMTLQRRCDEYGQPHPVIVPFSDDAAVILDEFQKSLFPRTQAASGLLAGHLGKMRGAACRLALVLTYLDWAASSDPEPQEIDARHVALACHMIEDYFIPMANRTFGDAALPLAERDAATIARRIVKDKLTNINERDIYREWGVAGLNRNPERVRKAMDVLEDANWTRPIASASTSGRKRRDHRVNPEVFQ